MSESKIQVSEFEKLIEIGNAFFLGSKSGTSYVIPKTAVDVTALKSEITKLHIPIIEKTNWQWK